MEGGDVGARYFMGADLRELKDAWPFPLPCTRTGFKNYRLAGQGSAIRLPPFSWDAPPLVPVSMFSTTLRVPAFETRTDFESGATRASKLSKLEVVVGTSSVTTGGDPWEVIRVKPFYELEFEGNMADAESKLCCSTTTVQVDVSALSELQGLKAPKFSAEASMAMALAALPLGGFLLLCMVGLTFIASMNIMERSSPGGSALMSSAGIRLQR